MMCRHASSYSKIFLLNYRKRRKRKPELRATRMLSPTRGIPYEKSSRQKSFCSVSWYGGRNELKRYARRPTKKQSWRRSGWRSSETCRNNFEKSVQRSNGIWKGDAFGSSRRRRR
jgi:hypothetical protein